MTTETSTVLVTGAASGIGRSVASRFAADGARLALVDVDEASLVATTEQLAPEAVAQSFQCDVTDALAVRRCVDDVVARFGRLHGLVHCAGISARARTLDITEADWDRVLDVNLKGTFLVCQAVARHMRSAGGGAIVCISSTQAEVSNGVQAHYTASKGGVRQLVKTFAVDLGEYAIRVNALGPGITRTPMTEHRVMDDAVRQGYEARIPLGRVGAAEDIAAAAAFLVSEEASWITGQSLYVDGGSLAGA